MSLENMLSPEDTFGGKPRKPVLVMGKIFADWCGHCVALKPEWAKLKRDVKAAMGRYFKNVRVEFHEIGDTPHNKARGLTVDGMLEKFNGRHMSNSPEKLALDGGYPTLFKVHKGKIEYYKGSRDAKSMFQWYYLARLLNPGAFKDVLTANYKGITDPPEVVIRQVGWRYTSSKQK